MRHLSGHRGKVDAIRNQLADYQCKLDQMKQSLGDEGQALTEHIYSSLTM